MSQIFMQPAKTHDKEMVKGGTTNYFGMDGHNTQTLCDGETNLVNIIGKNGNFFFEIKNPTSVLNSA